MEIPPAARDAWVRAARWSKGAVAWGNRVRDRPGPRAALAEARRALAVAAVLALALGATVAIGSRLANAYPSSSRPFGWPGDAGMDGAVATVRSALVLAASAPALWLGLRSLRRLDPTRNGLREWAATVGADASLLAAGAFVGAWLADLGSASLKGDAFVVFFSAHLLLAWASYGIGVLASCVTPSIGGPVAVSLWIFFGALFEPLVRWRVFREAGYHRIIAGDLPWWFFAAQAVSPVAAYRGFLIISRPEFRDFEEKAVLADTVLPPWMTPFTFALLLGVAWFLVPIEIAAGAWAWRRQRLSRAEGIASVTPDAVPQALEE